MAITSTVGQKALTTAGTAYQLTANSAAATTPIQRGIKLSYFGTGKCYYGPSGVSATTGFYIPTVAEIAPADFQFIGDIYFVSDTNTDRVCFDIVGQVVTIS
jgi:hypothetical protein